MGLDGDVTAPIFSKDAEVDGVIEDAVLVSGEAPDVQVPDSTVDVVDDDLDVDEDGELEAEDGDMAGGKKARSTKQYYNVVQVIGAELPSENAKYAGSSPSVAAKKAARRVFAKSGEKKFVLVMRKVSQQVAGRTLYKYQMEIEKLKNPVAFFNARFPDFKPAAGSKPPDDKKRVKIVRSTPYPIFGYVNAEGDVVKSTKDASGLGSLHRNPQNNTIVYNIGDRAIPKTVGGLKVNRTDTEPTFKRLTPTQEELDKWDVAGAHKQSLRDARQKAKTKKSKKPSGASKRA